MTERVTIYTDGGASPNPGYGGWAAILLYKGHEKTVTGNEEHTTNNRMELTAATRALQSLSRPMPVDLYTDSQYLRQGITKWIEGWLAKGRLKPGPKQVANADLWLDLYPLTHYHDVEWHWVKGHAGNVLNERVDRLVHSARQEIVPAYTKSTEMLTLFVKGSCRKTVGGWATILEDADGEDSQQFSGNALNTSNNQMELTAAVEGLSHIESGTPVRIITQSDYLHQGITSWIHGWQKRDWLKKDGNPVANTALWKRLIAELARVQPVWVNARGQKLPQFEAALTMAKAAIDDERQA